MNSKQKEESGFVDYLHTFRGFAIFCVVAVHVGAVVIGGYYDGMPDETDLVFIISESLFHASTIYFALISGLLFTVVLEKKGWKRFFRSKFLYVFLPYLFFTLLFSIGRPGTGPDDPGGIHTSLLEYLTAVGLNLIFGKAMPIFWYLPVLFCLYLLTPILSWIINQEGVGKWMIAPFVIAPLVISRQPIAFDYTFFWQDVVFFVGVYSVGMLVGTKLEGVMGWLTEKFKLLVALSIISLAGLIMVSFYQVGSIGITLLPETLHYVNKLLISGAVLVIFKKMEKQPWVLTILAEDAFAIYFLHFIAIFPAFILFIPLIKNPSYYPFSVILAMPLVVAGCLGLTKGVIWLLKKLFRKYSRMFIGS